MTNNKLESWQLKQRQSLPLEIKIRLSEERIRSWYAHWNGQVYVSFSGGKDSTVLLHLVRNLYPNVPAVFVDTGLEYPEIRDFVTTIPNVVWLKPEKLFTNIIKEFGYPIIGKEIAQKIYEVKTLKTEHTKNLILHGSEKGHSKMSEKWKYLLNAPFKISHKCCLFMKKKPFIKYERTTKRKSIIGMMASESRQRTTSYLRYGCNSFESNRPSSNPIAFWRDVDIWNYINNNNIPYSQIYNMGFVRTGCMFCMFGVHLEKGENRFQRMAKSHPKQYEYCIKKLGCGKILDFIGVTY